MTDDNRVEVTRTRRSITTQLREHCAANGLSYETAEINGQLKLVINGEPMTPGEAADRYLPGGFAGSYGRA